jgi:putative oxidoreductase
MTDSTSNALFIEQMAPLYRRLNIPADALLRFAVGGFLVPHGAQKLFGWFGGYGLEATGQFFSGTLGFANGYLAALASGSVEFFGGIMLAVGLLTRVSAAAVATLLLVALSFHTPNGFFWTDGGFEYPLLWSLLALYFWVKGGGSLSLDRLIGREF